jgi:hypothetical protein
MAGAGMIVGVDFNLSAVAAGREVRDDHFVNPKEPRASLSPIS